jgi:hypothetical protein
MLLIYKTKVTVKSIFVVVVSICCSTLYAQQQPADYVNPFIGTSNFGATYPGPIAARGMASISPFNVAGAQNLPLEKDSRWLSTHLCS